jgi:hypothetical protein
MAILPVFNTTNADEIIASAGSGLVNIPEGEYKATIIKSEMKDTSSGGQALNLTFVITEGQYRNTELVERLNLINSNDTAVKIATETLARITKAAGMATLPNDSIQLHNKPMLVKVKTEPAKPYKDKNGVEQPGSPRSVLDSKGYAKLPGIGVAPSAAPAVAQATADAAGKMPWERD